MKLHFSHLKAIHKSKGDPGEIFQRRKVEKNLDPVSFLNKKCTRIKVSPLVR